MKKLLYSFAALAISLAVFPSLARADGGVYASGGKSVTVGTTFSVTVTASGATFDSLQGVISVSGPVSVVSFSPGGATWLPGKTPSNGGQFVGIVSETSSTTVATIKLKGTSVGSGSVSVSGVRMADKGNIVGGSAGGTNFTITRAPVLPNSVAIASSTHPDQSAAYEATTVTLSWNKDKGVDGFSYVFDAADGTTPPSKINTTDTSLTMANQAVGTYFLHVMAHDGDGWGPVSEFKVTIKPPSAKVNDQLPKPKNFIIKKAASFKNNIADGTISGIVISGTTEPKYNANVILSPAPTLPDGKTMSALADAQGNFSLTIDFPIKSGYYSMTVQGQNDLTLTPVSDPVTFEASQAKGGTVSALTSADTLPPVIPTPTAKKWYEKINWLPVSIGLASLWLISIVLVVTLAVIKKINLKKLTRLIR